MKGWTWLVAFIAAASVIAAVAFGAYQAGRHHADSHDAGVVRITTPADGSTPGVQVVRVEDGGRHWGGHWGFFPGFFFLPLLFLFLFFVCFRWGRWGGWRRDYWDDRRFD